MNDLTLKIISVIAAYLIGSIPTSIWVGKLFYGIDIRLKGSGNAGATNTFRVLGIKAGIPVLLFDIMKGLAAVKLVSINGIYSSGTNEFVLFQIVLGLCAVIGHIYPVYAGFKGGKGVATLLGMVLAIEPGPALMALVVFCISLIISRYVSLSSMLSGLTFPFIVIFLFKIKIISVIVFSLSVALLLFYTHRKNIVRLMNGTESKANIFGKKKNTEKPKFKA